MFVGRSKTFVAALLYILRPFVIRENFLFTQHQDAAVFCCNSFWRKVSQWLAQRWLFGLSRTRWRWCGFTDNNAEQIKTHIKLWLLQPPVITIITAAITLFLLLLLMFYFYDHFTWLLLRYISDRKETTYPPIRTRTNTPDVSCNVSKYCRRKSLPVLETRN